MRPTTSPRAPGGRAHGQGDRPEAQAQQGQADRDRRNLAFGTPVSATRTDSTMPTQTTSLSQAMAATQREEALQDQTSAADRVGQQEVEGTGLLVARDRPAPPYTATP